MGNKERYFIFAIGVFIGCMILAISYTGKYNTVKKQNEKDVLHGYKTLKGIVPGQDLEAKKPFDIGPALFTQDLEQDAEGTFKRIIIARASGKDGAVCRIVETLWRNAEDPTREKLIRRQIMAADKVIVRLKKDANDIDQFKNELKNFGMELFGSGRGPRLYKIQLASYNIDIVPQAIETLISKSKMIEAAFPDYILNF